MLPQRGFSACILRISVWSSVSMRGRPPRRPQRCSGCRHQGRALPAADRLWLQEQQRFAPLRPPPGEQDPEQTIPAAEHAGSATAMAALADHQLVPQRDVLQYQVQAFREPSAQSHGTLRILVRSLGSPRRIADEVLAPHRTPRLRSGRTSLELLTEV